MGGVPRRGVGQLPVDHECSTDRFRCCRAVFGLARSRRKADLGGPASRSARARSLSFASSPASAAVHAPEDLEDAFLSRLARSTSAANGLAAALDQAGEGLSNIYKVGGGKRPTGAPAQKLHAVCVQEATQNIEGDGEIEVLRQVSSRHGKLEPKLADDHPRDVAALIDDGAAAIAWLDWR